MIPLPGIRGVTIGSHTSELKHGPPYLTGLLVEEGECWSGDGAEAAAETGSQLLKLQHWHVQYRVGRVWAVWWRILNIRRNMSLEIK